MRGALTIWALTSLSSCTLALEYPEERPVDESELAFCGDTIDNDRDGFVDYQDLGCWPFARADVTRCARVDGVHVLDAFSRPIEDWDGAGTFVDKGDGTWALQPDEMGAQKLFARVITGDPRSLEITLDLEITPDAYEGTGSEPILTVLRARDVPGPDVSRVEELEGVFVGTALIGEDGVPISLLTFRGGIGEPETGTARIILRVTDAGPTIEVRTATQAIGPTEPRGSVSSWSATEALRILWRSPRGLQVRTMSIETSGASSCGGSLPASPQFAPPISTARAVATSDTRSCVVFADSAAVSPMEGTSFAGGSSDGTSWNAPISVTEGIRSCVGVVWDEDARRFQAMCSRRAGPGLALAVSEDCGGVWPLIETAEAVERTSHASGFTVLGDNHELWHASADALVRGWLDESFSAYMEDPPERLALDDGTTLIAPDVEVRVHRRGRDRYFVRTDGIGVALWVATGLEGGPVRLRRAFDPLLTPTGILGSFDASFLTAAAVSVVSGHDEAVRLLIVYSGSAHCNEDEVCGQWAGTATARILPP